MKCSILHAINTTIRAFSKCKQMTQMQELRLKSIFVLEISSRLAFIERGKKKQNELVVSPLDLY